MHNNPPQATISPPLTKKEGEGEGEREEEGNISFTTTVTAVGGSFGLQIIGGADSAVPAQIELLLPGRKYN